MAEERNKTHVGKIFVPIFVFRNSSDPHEFLGSWIGSDRNHQSPVELQLLLQRVRDFRATRRDDDRIIRGMFRPATRTIAVTDMHIRITTIRQDGGGLFRQLTYPLDGVDLSGDFGEHRGRIA